MLTNVQPNQGKYCKVRARDQTVSISGRHTQEMFGAAEFVHGNNVCRDLSGKVVEAEQLQSRILVRMGVYRPKLNETLTRDCLWNVFAASYQRHQVIPCPIHFSKGTRKVVKKEVDETMEKLRSRYHHVDFDQLTPSTPWDDDDDDGDTSS